MWSSVARSGQTTDVKILAEPGVGQAAARFQETALRPVAVSHHAVGQIH
jgi:hypothetical protein